MSDFHGNRMVVDLSGGRIVHVPVTGREALVSAIERVLHVRLELREGKVLLKNRDAKGYEVAAGAELLEFSGKPTEEWLSRLENPGSERYELLSELHNNARTSLLRLRLTDGRVVTSKVPGS